MATKKNSKKIRKSPKRSEKHYVAYSPDLLEKYSDDDQMYGHSEYYPYTRIIYPHEQDIYKPAKMAKIFVESSAKRYKDIYNPSKKHIDTKDLQKIKMYVVPVPKIAVDKLRDREFKERLAEFNLVKDKFPYSAGRISSEISARETAKLFERTRRGRARRRTGRMTQKYRNTYRIKE